MKLNKTREEDLYNIRVLRQMVIEAEREKQLNLISNREYQYILSKAIGELDILEAKYGI